MKRFVGFASALAIDVVAMSLRGCSLVASVQQTRDERRREVIQRTDIAHVFVTLDDLPRDKPYKVLGDIKYSEPFDSELDQAEINRHLRALAVAMYPDQADAVIKVNDDIQSSSGTTGTVTATGEVVQFDTSTNRKMLHDMADEIVASPR